MATDDIEKFLAQETFYCTHLRSRLKPEDCVIRQERKIVQVVKMGSKFKKYTDTASEYCRSGSCEQGKLVKLKVNGSG